MRGAPRRRSRDFFVCSNVNSPFDHLRTGKTADFGVESFDTTRQEGWLSPTERASISAISLRHNLATSRESLRYVVAFTRFAGGGIWLPQQSLRHILASPGYAPRTIAVNITWMERWFNVCQTHRSMYPSIFNRLRAIARYWLEIATFSYPPPLGVFPLEFRENVWSS